MSYNLSLYADITKVINDKLYAKDKHINVRKMNNCSLYMLNYDKSKINKENIKTLGLFRSVITDGEKVLCFSCPKAIDYTEFMKNVSYDKVVVEDFVEGTMINLFYYNEEWMCATKSIIGAKCKFFRDYPKTYRTLFLEAMESSNLEFNMLNKSYCYSFILQHPENRIVVPFSEMRLIIVNMYKCINMEVEEVNVKLAFPGYNGLDDNDPKVYLPKRMNEVATYEKYNGKSYGELYDYFTSLNLDYKIMGVVLKHGKYRTKIWNPNYLKVKLLRGNNPKIQFQYYNLLNDKRLMEFLYYYPEYKQLFNTYKMDLFNWTEQLWKNYKSCYIRKEAPLKTYPLQFRTHMFNIHQDYINHLKPSKKRTDKLFIINYVNSLEPAQLMFSINYVFREVNIDETKKNYDMLSQELSPI
jgi:hypothetical protein